jgi:hypothetical protein
LRQRATHGAEADHRYIRHFSLTVVSHQRLTLRLLPAASEVVAGRHYSLRQLFKSIDPHRPSG